MCAVELVCCCCSWIYSSLPVNKQMLALSATYPEALAQQLTDYMRNPTFIRLNVTDPALLGTSPSTLRGACSCMRRGPRCCPLTST